MSFVKNTSPLVLYLSIVWWQMLFHFCTKFYVIRNQEQSVHVLQIYVEPAIRRLYRSRCSLYGKKNLCLWSWLANLFAIILVPIRLSTTTTSNVIQRFYLYCQLCRLFECLNKLLTTQAHKQMYDSKILGIIAHWIWLLNVDIMARRTGLE